MQSPIDIRLANSPSAESIFFDYKPVTLEILNNGLTVQFNVNNGSAMASHGQTYKLRQVHFYTPSEHTIRGKHYAMEAHFPRVGDASRPGGHPRKWRGLKEALVHRPIEQLV